jgi:hypothetical protein
MSSANINRLYSEPRALQLDEDSWEDLLTLIEDGQVIPVVGSGVVTRADDQSLFYPWLAGQVAKRLGVAPDRLPADPDLSAVAAEYIRNERDRNALYLRIARILRDECPAPGQSLLDLASISAFNLYLTTTFDPLLERALNDVRYSRESGTKVFAFSPEAECTDLPWPRRELPGTNVFHLLGRVSSIPEYVAWEEDLLDFICALNKQMPVMECLGRDLKEHGLLLIGLEFSDWVVRFFLRVSKQQPLSTPQVQAYIADRDDFAPGSLVLFLSAVSRDIRVVHHDPIAFCAELAKRWNARPQAQSAPTRLHLPPISAAIPPGAIFVSYAREDEAAAASLVAGLQAGGCTVWYDLQRMQAGENWENALEDEVKEGCSLFLSVISNTTQATRESYYHAERNWAAERVQRMADGEVFYIPVVIDMSDDFPPLREPRSFRHKQATRLIGGVVTPDFVARIRALQQKAMEERR